ncbi:MAG: electron transfer flavoprotein subunit alpha/FixB family protein [Chitinophagaceae bacterium]
MILIFAEQQNGQFKKASLEAISYGAKLAELQQCEAKIIVLGEASDIANLAQYGVATILHASDSRLKHLNAKAYTKAIAEIAQQQQAHTIIFSNNNTAKSIAPRLSVRLQAGLVSGVVAMPSLQDGFVVKKSVFSGKAFSYVKINTDKKILSIIPNSFGVEKKDMQAAIENISLTLDDQDFGVTMVSQNKVTGIVPLSEAELVVSGGRGLKGPENWGILEDLANSIGATLACSRPVADSHWRPHHEHVGQTGGTIRPNLYIAVGISGAIQHLAGVNSSKTIVVINKDQEAPFFKAADYGVLGDAFEVVPKLTEAIKKFKGTLQS